MKESKSLEKPKISPLKLESGGRQSEVESFRAFSLVKMGALWTVLTVDIKNKFVEDFFCTEPDTYNMAVMKLSSLLRKNVKSVR